jgi:hypothetical protein
MPATMSRDLNQHQAIVEAPTQGLELVRRVRGADRSCKKLRPASSWQRSTFRSSSWSYDGLGRRLRQPVALERLPRSRGCVQVLYRLQEKRIALEKVVMQYGEAPAGIKEVFELCRGFERAYMNYINVSSGCSSQSASHSTETGMRGCHQLPTIQNSHMGKIPYSRAARERSPG